MDSARVRLSMDPVHRVHASQLLVKALDPQGVLAGSEPVDQLGVIYDSLQNAPGRINLHELSQTRGLVCSQSVSSRGVKPGPSALLVGCRCW